MIVDTRVGIPQFARADLITEPVSPSRPLRGGGEEIRPAGYVPDCKPFQCILAILNRQ